MAEVVDRPALWARHPTLSRESVVVVHAWDEIAWLHEARLDRDSDPLGSEKAQTARLKYLTTLLKTNSFLDH